MPSDDPFTSFFHRLKQQVDEQIGTALQGALGLPTVLSKTMNTQWMDPPATTFNTSPDTNTGVTEAAERRGVSRDPARGPANPNSTSWLASLVDPEVLAETLYQSLWISFLVDSPHSPLKLRGLRQPVPSDLPEGADPRLFGFEDAFEDLLMVSSGQGLPDIRERCELKKEWNRLYPQGLPPVLWLHQLCRQGLWDGWEPRPASLEDMISERWRRWLAAQDDRFEDKSVTKDDDQQPKETRAANPSDSPLTESTAARPSSGTEETEEDAYDTIVGRQNPRGIEAHLEELMKAFAFVDDQSREGNGREVRSTSPRELPEGWRVDETVQEQKDVNGNTKTTRTSITYDEQGREVGRETETRSHYSWSATRSAHEKGHGENSDNHKNETGTTDQGWFWK
ncbi:hypothetical protein VDGD_06325 [Verticillium dahliae]|nr:hypothetical protein VdG1_00274 [Verticillium dahliae VDG1]RBQ90303.1 hypothetical protein VDGD_06325 [Verticillium dahliae]